MKRIFFSNWILLKMGFKVSPWYVLAKIFSSVFQIVQPIGSIWLFKLFLDGILTQQSFQYCVNIIIILIVINEAAYIYTAILNYRFSPIFNQKVTKTVTEALLNKYLHVDMKDLDNPDFYNKYTQVLNDLPTRVVSNIENITNFIGNILSVATVVSLMISMDPWMILVSLIGIVANILFTPFLNKLGYESYKERSGPGRILNYVKRVFYIYDYIKELKLFPIKEVLYKKYDGASDKIISVVKKYSIKHILLVLLIGVLELSGLVVVLLILAYKALAGLLTVGEVSALYNATESLKSGVSSLFSIVPKLMENRLYVDNYLSFMDIHPVIELSDGMKVDHVESIRFENVSFSYSLDSSKLALKNIDLKIEQNQKIALIGHNGAGKSTFINLITRLYDPLEGTLYLNGKPYSLYDINSLRSLFLVVFQDCQKYATTIAENVLMRSLHGAEDEQRVIHALKKVGLYEKVIKFPKGIYTILTKEFDNDGIVFSGGEQQKLIVARALASDAKVIVLDEVTSNMDAVSEHEVFAEILRSVEDKSVIYVSHKLSTTKYADKIYLLNQGEIAESGTHTELMNLHGIYREMFMVQAEKYGDFNV